MKDQPEISLEELLSIDGLPGVTDAEGNTLVPYEAPEIEDKQSHPDDIDQDVKDDYTNVRNNVYFQQELLKRMLLKVYETATMSDNARYYEVFATMMGQMNLNNKQILDIQHDIKTLRDKTSAQGTTQPQQGSTQITAQTVFVGSPSELMGKLGGQVDAKSRNALNEKVINDDELD